MSCWETDRFWEERDDSTRMLEVDWRCTGAANLRIVVFAVFCEVLLNTVEEKIVGLLFGVFLVLVLVRLKRFG